MNANDLIGQYIKIRDHIEARSKAHSEELAPYQAGLKTIEDAVSALLIEQAGGDEGKANIVTPNGTAYRKRWTSIKMSDRPTFMAFVGSDFAHRQNFLTAAVTKSEVEEYIETNKMVPPGLDVARGYNTLFNRPKG